MSLMNYCLNPEIVVQTDFDNWSTLGKLKGQRLIDALYTALQTGELPGKHGDTYSVGNGRPIAACVHGIHVVEIKWAAANGVPVSPKREKVKLAELEE